MNLGEVFGSVDRLLGRDDSRIQTVRGLRFAFDLLTDFINDDLPDVGAHEPGIPYRGLNGTELTLDVTVPRGEGPFPVLVYLHGGAWIWGSPATHRKLTHRIAEQGFLTLSVDYRLAPENPFPAGFNDCIHALHFAHFNAERWNGDPTRLVVAGDSAGGNLAAACSIELANETTGPRIRAAGLLYGVYDFAHFEGDGLTEELISAYLGSADRALLKDPRVSPVVKASQLPPTHIAIGSDDPLIEHAEALRARLARAGVVHDYHVYKDMPHAFAQMEFLDSARPAIGQMCAFLHEQVAGP